MNTLNNRSKKSFQIIKNNLIFNKNSFFIQKNSINNKIIFINKNYQKNINRNISSLATTYLENNYKLNSENNVFISKSINIKNFKVYKL